MPERKTWKERWAEAGADADRRAEQKRAKNAERAADEHAGLRATCIYRGSTLAAERLKIGSQYTLTLDRAGISVRSLVLSQELLRVAWGSVVDVEITDKSQTHIKTRVVHKASGGLASPIGTTAPVAKTSSQHVAVCEVSVKTADGEWLLSVWAGPAELRGKLMVCRHLWATPPSAPARPQQDPAVRLARVHELHAAGLITDADLQAKKAEILAEI